MANQQSLDFSDEIYETVLRALSNTQRESITNEISKAIIDFIILNEIETEEPNNE